MATKNSFYARLNARRHKSRSTQEKVRDNAKPFQEINTPIRRASQSAAWNTGYSDQYKGYKSGR